MKSPMTCTVNSKFKFVEGWASQDFEEKQLLQTTATSDIINSLNEESKSEIEF